MADIVRERCEGAGRPSGWLLYTWEETTGSSDWDYASSPAPLAGAQSLRIATDGGRRIEYFTVSDLSAIYWYMTFCLDTVVSGNTHELCSLWTSALALLLAVERNSSGNLAARSDSDSAHASNYAVAAGTQYHLWLEWHSAGAVQVWISTSGAKPVDPAISYTTSATGLLYGMGPATSYGGGIIVDDMLATDAQIGSYPFSPFPPHFARKQNILLRR